MRHMTLEMQNEVGSRTTSGHSVHSMLTSYFIFLKLMQLYLSYEQMRMRAVGEWALDDDDEVEYNHRLESGETSGEGKQQDLVYYLAVSTFCLSLLLVFSTPFSNFYVF
jgi:hypothetical protein